MATGIAGMGPAANTLVRSDGTRFDFYDWYVEIIEEFNGNAFGAVGRVYLAEFTSVVYALRASIKLQQDLAQHQFSKGNRPKLQIGLHLGEQVVERETITGDGVDIALGLQRLAKPSGIFVSTDVHTQIYDKVDCGFRYVGEQAVDSISRLIGAYRVIDERDERSLTNIISELSRRRIFRSAGAYVVAAWLIVQASDIVLPVFDAPAWILRSMIILLVVGFPLAMLLTWSVNLGAEGIIKTSQSRYSKTTGRWLKFAVVGAATAVSVLVLVSLRSALFEPPPERTIRRSDIKPQPVVAVAELTKLVGDPSMDWLGLGISNLLRDSFADSSQATVYSLAALQLLSTDVDSGTRLAQAAKAAGVDYLIAGDYRSTASGIVITTHIEDLENGRIIPGGKIEARGIEDAIAGTTQMIRRLKQSLNIPYLEQVGYLAADFAAENLRAYELYVSGLEYFTTFDYENAIGLFEAALDEAPGFEIVKFRLAQIFEATGRNKDALALLNTIQPENLSEREQYYIAGAKLKFAENRDTDGAIRVYKELVSAYPFDSEAHQNLAEAYWLDFQDAASIGQLELLVDLHPQEAVSWMALGERQIDVGDNSGASVSLAKYVSMRPDDPYPHALLGQLAAIESRYAEARSHYERALAIRPSMGIAELGLAHLEYFEDNVDGAMARWLSIVESPAVVADHRIDAAFDYANILRALGKPQEVLEVMTRVADEIASEGLRESLELVTRANALVDLERLDEARSMLNEAVEKTPSSTYPTRPLFFLGLLALREADLNAFTGAVTRMEGIPVDAGSVGDRDRLAAIDYLNGLHALEQNPDSALELIRRAIDLPEAYHYALYELGLAQATAASGNHNTALRMLAEISDIDAKDPRLDLEYERRLALLLRAELLIELNRSEEAAAVVAQFVDAWPGASETHPAMRRARGILTALP